MGNKVKNVCLLCVCLFISACQMFSQDTATKPYDLALFDSNVVRTFSVSQTGLSQVETLTRPIQKHINPKTFYDVGDQYMTVTYPTNGLDIVFDRIDKKTLKETVTPLEKDVYAAVTDGTHYYTASVFTTHIEFKKYDKVFNVVETKTVENNETKNASQQMLVAEDDMYVLVSNVVMATGEPQTELWRMDKSFNILEKINLFESSAYMRMVYWENKLYITETYNGTLPSGEPSGGTRLLIYDVTSRDKSFVYLETAYPKDVYLDEMHQKLLIRHGSENLNEFVFTVYDIHTQTQEKIDFLGYNKNEYVDPFVSMNKGNYYFLFKDKLVEYTVETQVKSEFDLKPFAFEYAHGMIWAE